MEIVISLREAVFSFTRISPAWVILFIFDFYVIFCKISEMIFAIVFSELGSFTSCSFLFVLSVLIFQGETYWCCHPHQ
uniref:Uncharacterized protein n=1 Tax=Kalanchoe fedtschenkoi TaxID=63787 RepID=A0A7N0VHL6_KALFE